MMKRLILITAFLMAGCAPYGSSLDVRLEGKGIKSPYGLINEGSLEIKRARQIGRGDQYLQCLHELSQCEAEIQQSRD